MRARAPLCALLLAVTGCGGAAVSSGATLAPDSQRESYQTLEQASAAFERYAAELGPYAQNDEAAPNAAAPDFAQPPAPAPAPSAAPRPSMAPEVQSGSSDATADRSSRPSDLDKAEAEPPRKNSCEIPCKALASMKRAGDAICRLDAADGAHCKQAKQRIAAATDRLASCGCAS